MKIRVRDLTELLLLPYCTGIWELTHRRKQNLRHATEKGSADFRWSLRWTDWGSFESWPCHGYLREGSFSCNARQM